jgi:hypothetical protein
MIMRSGILLAIGATLALAGSASASPYMVQFTGGVYPIAVSCPGAALPCDQSTNATLTVTVSGPQANFVVDVTGDQSATLSFDLPDYLAPTGVEPGGSPYFTMPNLTAATWDTATYPYVTIWSPADGGGISVAGTPDDSGDVLLALFESEQTTSSPFTLTGTPEPATWAMLIVGAGMTGATLRRRRMRLA